MTQLDKAVLIRLMSTTVGLARARPVGTARYTVTAQALHWVTSVLMLAVIVLAWVMVNMDHGAASRGWLYTLHKSVGLTILVLVAIRLAWRAANPPPRLPTSLAAWERASAAASHVMLYVILVGMPLSGYIMSAAGRFPVTYFGLFTVPSLPQNKAVSEAAHWVHVATGQWLVYALVVLHLSATAWHVAVRRDGVLERMLPSQTTD